MASYLHITHFRSILLSKLSTLKAHSNTQFISIPFPTPRCLRQLNCHVSCIPQPVPLSATSTSIQCSLSSPSPRTSREEPNLQAKTSLSTALEKPLNNPKLIGKLKKLKRPKFRVEIPVVDDSPDALSQLALEVFGDIPIKRKGSPIKTLILWPNPSLKEAASEAFQSHSLCQVEHVDILSISKTGTRILNSADVAVFLVPEAS